VPLAGAGERWRRKEGASGSRVASQREGWLGGKGKEAGQAVYSHPLKATKSRLEVAARPLEVETARPRPPPPPRSVTIKSVNRPLAWL
jgi:hypothetical protein